LLLIQLGFNNNNYDNTKKSGQKLTQITDNTEICIILKLNKTTTCPTDYSSGFAFYTIGFQ